MFTPEQVLLRSGNNDTGGPGEVQETQVTPADPGRNADSNLSSFQPDPEEIPRQEQGVSHYQAEWSSPALGTQLPYA